MSKELNEYICIVEATQEIDLARQGVTGRTAEALEVAHSAMVLANSIALRAYEATYKGGVQCSMGNDDYTLVAPNRGQK